MLDDDVPVLKEEVVYQNDPYLVTRLGNELDVNDLLLRWKKLVSLAKN